MFVRDKHLYQRINWTDRGVCIMKDGYLQCQISYLTYQVWSISLKQKTGEYCFGILIDFFFANTRLCQLGNHFSITTFRFFSNSAFEKESEILEVMNGLRNKSGLLNNLFFFYACH